MPRIPIRLPALVLFLIPSVPILGQSYVWPVEAAPTITSNFGEYRPRRFHAGMDVRTRETPGPPVVAVGDGYVWRAKVSSGGYGRVLYVRLDDSRIAVYAHLDRFAPLLDEVVRGEQERSGSYSVDRYFGPREFPVRKGEFLGISGESGSAFGPHLHFELRDSSNYPLNPLTHGFTLPDARPPVPSSLAVIPLAPDAEINGSPLPQVFRLKKTGADLYEPAEPIHVFGAVGLAISAGDPITRMPGDFNLFEASLTVDSFLRYAIRFDSYPLEFNALVETQRDPVLKSEMGKEFHRLFLLPGRAIPGLTDPSSQGKLSLPDGRHSFQISIGDPAGNRAHVAGTLIHLPPYSIAAEVVGRTKNSVTIRATSVGNPFPLERAVCNLFGADGTPLGEVKPVRSAVKDGRLEMEIPVRNFSRHFLTLRATNNQGAVSRPAIFNGGVAPTDPLASKISLTVRHLESSVLLIVTSTPPLDVPPTLVLAGSSTDLALPAIAISPGRFVSQAIRPEVTDGVEGVTVRLHGSPSRDVRFPIRFGVAPFSREKTVASGDGRCGVTAYPSSFYDTTAVWIIPSDVSAPEGTTMIGNAYGVHPSGRPICDSVRVDLSWPRGERPPHTALFAYDNVSEGWSILSANTSAKTGAFTSFVTSLETVAILQDTIPPVIKPRIPDSGGRYRSGDLKAITALVKDAVAGIGSEENLELTLDGSRLITEYHPIKRTAIARLHRPLPPGSHTLTISATDRLGNRASAEVPFTVN